MKITDLFSLEDLELALQDGYVREQTHPNFPDLRILNYSEKAQWEKVWTDVTRNCRGLIVDSATHEIIARPFPKFFNYAEVAEEISLALDEAALVTDKVDGSLGIFFRRPDGEWAVATRGSFASDQAIKGTEMLRALMAEHDWTPSDCDDFTLLAEIVYPENRIVLDYHGYEGLVLIGAMSLQADAVSPWSAPEAKELAGWPGEVTQLLPATSIREALSLPDRENAEGMVVHLLESNLQVKIKQAWYVEMHRIVTGLTERRVWEYMSEHDICAHGLAADLPDEFATWVTDVEADLLDQFEEVMGIQHDLYDTVLDELDEQFGEDGCWGRAEFAKAAQGYGSNAKYLFLLLDGKDISETVWREVRP